MSSLLTNTSAMSALASLTATQKSLSGVQNQISSGLRVADASDNAAYWSIATTMKLGQQALFRHGSATLSNLGAAKTDTASPPRR